MVDKKFKNLQWSLNDSVSQSSADKTDESRKRWGAVCQGKSTGGKWSNEEQLLHINLIELKAIKLTLLIFNKQKPLKSVHFQIDSTTALLYLVKMVGGGGGDRN